MGLYIKGINREILKKGAVDMTLAVGADGEIVAMEMLIDSYARHYEAIEVPEPHGRLIDENEVRVVMSYICSQPERPTWNTVYHGICNMNAVIEAEN